jgi:hypothetical protein
VVERQVTGLLRPATVARLVRWELVPRGGQPGFWRLAWELDMEAYAYLRDRQFGRRLLATNRDSWSSAALVEAYGGQAEAEHVFRHLKDPEHLALRPQYHWTDQKIRVHSLCCVLGYLLAALLRRRARQLGYEESLEELLEMLQGIRAVLAVECRETAGRPRARWQLEEADPRALRLYEALAADRYRLGPT